jgi:E3 ubiquitin-protein ligase RNF115/126
MSLLFGHGFGGGNMGDYLNTQEDFDRAISELMEQNQMGHAPPPAESQDIASLPKVPITEAMLGENGKADCSVCMDSVELGEHVTKLYCDHWFHEQCISMWLTEHNTCPHCRKSIAEGQEMARERGMLEASTSSGTLPSAACSANASSFQDALQRAEPATPHRRTSSILRRGRGDGSGYYENPDPPRMRSPTSQSGNNNGGGGGGIGNFVRRLTNHFNHNNNNNDGDRHDSR